MRAYVGGGKIPLLKVSPGLSHMGIQREILWVDHLVDHGILRHDVTSYTLYNGDLNLY